MTPRTHFAQVLITASLTFYQTGTVVKKRPMPKLSKIEQEVVAEIRVLRASRGGDLSAIFLGRPARIVHHFISASHGNVQLRLTTLARELGVEMRTLQRAFVTEYHKTMAQSQMETRLAFSQWLLTLFPPTKISAVGSMLGYDRVQDFNRFFKKHTHQSPAEWGRNERAKIARGEELDPPD